MFSRRCAHIIPGDTWHCSYDITGILQYSIVKQDVLVRNAMKLHVKLACVIIWIYKPEKLTTETSRLCAVVLYTYLYATNYEFSVNCNTTPILKLVLLYISVYSLYGQNVLYVFYQKRVKKFFYYDFRKIWRHAFRWSPIIALLILQRLSGVCLSQSIYQIISVLEAWFSIIIVHCTSLILFVI